MRNGGPLLLFGLLMFAFTMLDCYRYRGKEDEFIFNMPLPRLIFHRANLVSAMVFIVFGVALIGLKI